MLFENVKKNVKRHKKMKGRQKNQRENFALEILELYQKNL